MKKNWILYILLVGLFCACEQDEDSLQPSYKDIDRVASQVDLSRPIVKRIYEDYNVGILYQYDDTLDFAYVAQTDEAASLWGQVDIPQISSLFVDEEGNIGTEGLAEYNQYVDDALAFVDTAIFKFFTPGSMIASKLPAKVLISSSVYANQQVNTNALTESEARYSRYTDGSLSMVYNAHSIVINVNQDEVTQNREDFIVDDFYVFLAKVLEMNNLYSLVPEEFYANKEDYYGQEMDAIYREEMGIDEETSLSVIDKDWIYSKGFIDAQYFYNSPSGLGSVWEKIDGEWVKHSKAFKPRYNFVSGFGEDVRSYINELLFRNTSEFEAFPENIQDNLRLIYNMLAGWGVDLMSLNPDIEVLITEV